ncbi:MAG: hypothetical protein IRY94_02395 [Rhodospirillaceae bacterium]|nr:hypothetical protein [Rhodospirillaceae bacterium]
MALAVPLLAAPAPAAQAPVQPATPAQPDADPRFIGTWQAQAGGGQGLVITRLTFQADGTFIQQSYGPARAPFHLWGRYAPAGANRLQFAIAGWSPQQSCTRQGCTPIRLRSQEFAAYRFLGPWVLQLGANTFHRTR